ncbi:hypothetical protein RVM26_09425 [Halomonas sp. KM072]
MSIFDELQTSLQEAVEINQGNTEASRTARHEVADVKSHSYQAQCFSGGICQRNGNQRGYDQKLGRQT